MNITENFTLDEFIFSDYAARHGLDNTPTGEVLENIHFLANRMEEVRVLLGGCPIRITSGYRSEAVNAGIGGSFNSTHRVGLAADFVAPRYGPPLAVARTLLNYGFKFDQLIHEYGRWVHIGFRRQPSEQRQQALTIFEPGVYLPGIIRR